MKHPFLPHTGLLFSSLAILSLSVMAADSKKTAGELNAADNAAKNTGGNSDEARTLLDQSNNPEDLRLKQEIRKVLIDDDTLSFDAKNVRIITAEGQVTLRGVVDSTDEKTRIGKLAKRCAGSSAVVNQIEVKDVTDRNAEIGRKKR